MRRVLILVLATVLTLFAVPRGLAAQEPPVPASGSSAPPPGGGLRIPPRVGTFVLSGRQDFPQPGAGSRFRYVAPDSLYADLYLYPGPDLGERCDLACAERVIEQ